MILLCATLYFTKYLIDISAMNSFNNGTELSFIMAAIKSNATEIKLSRLTCKKLMTG